MVKLVLSPEAVEIRPAHIITLFDTSLIRHARHVELPMENTRTFHEALEGDQP